MSVYQSDFYKRICDASMQLQKHMFKPFKLYLGLHEQGEFIRLLEEEWPIVWERDQIGKFTNRFNRNARAELSTHYIGFEIIYVRQESFFGYEGYREPRETQPTSETPATQPKVL